MIKKREYNFYDSDHYKDFGLQPDVFRIEIGYSLIPLVDEDYEKSSPLLKEIKTGRNEFDAKYGIPIPSVRIVDNMKLEPYQYAILFNGVEVARYNDVENICENKEKAKVIRTHLYEIAYQNRTKILNQCWVNTLVDKVRLTNPDVVSDVFFKKEFQTSRLKIVLNQLLAEDVSIRDMNTILETIADYIDGGPAPYQLVEHIRKRLAFGILSKYADKDKNIHAINVSENVAELLLMHLCIPANINDMPYPALAKEDREKLVKKIDKAVANLSQEQWPPIFIIQTDARFAFASFLEKDFPYYRVISIDEAYETIKEFSVKAEGELDWNE